MKALSIADHNRLYEMAQRMVDRRKHRAAARKRSIRKARRLKKRLGG